MEFETEWRFSASTVPIDEEGTDDAAIILRVITAAQAAETSEKLRPKIEALYTTVLATVESSPTLASATESVFGAKPDSNEAMTEATTTKPPARECNLVFLVYRADDTDTLIGYSRSLKKCTLTQ